MSDELVHADSVLVAPALSRAIAVVCACGWGIPSSEVARTPNLFLELEEHIRKRHPDATGARMTLAVYPVEP